MFNTGKIIVELQEWMGSDQSIANAAWTSTYNKKTRDIKYDDSEKVSNLVRKIILDGHGVPVESVIFRFWMRIPIFSDRQHMTHRIASNSGLSGRYRTMPMDWYTIPEDCQQILKKLSSQHGYNYCTRIQGEYDRVCQQAYNQYRDHIKYLREREKEGVISNSEFKRLREIIRGQLPVCGMIERTSIMNLRSFANYQKQRNSDHAQPEIRFVAQEMLRLVKEINICPVAISTLEEINWRI